MSEEIYKRYRPTSFKQMVGQDEAVRALTEMGKSGSIPHTILFSGPSGCGKTTLARILKTKLKCSDHDFCEVNAADDRGIDTIRDIKQRMFLSPIGGECRVWLIDESHSLTAQAQQSFLKILEDTPKHVYFFLASTEPNKLLKTIITRSTEIKVRELTEAELVQLVNRIVTEEEKKVPESVVVKIADIADGSARKALVLLHQVISIDEEEKQLEILQHADIKRQAIEICRVLMNEKATWKEMTDVLKNVDEDSESIRWMVLSYFTKVAMGKPARACMIIEEFEEPFYNSKKAGLIRACYSIISSK